MIRIIVFTVSYFVLASLNLAAQYSHLDVLKGEYGTALFSDLQEQYTPSYTLDYSVARDTLFLKIDAVNNVLECVYTGLKITIPPGEDPTDAVYMNGANNGINTEHTYPQGFGLEFSKGRSDMHHLFPSRIKTNGDRGNLPFGESPDNQTTRWYLESTEMSTIPSQNINEYSELESGKLFEPRESHKGDVARAMFYIYTIYNEDVSEDTFFFHNQKKTLCDWHFQDPVSQKEWERTFKIAAYQDGKVNPFVLDCSLASRLYCDQISAPCALISSISDENLHPTISATIIPNPFNGTNGVLSIHVEKSETGELVLYNATGIIVWRSKVDLIAGEVSNLIPLEIIQQKGLYFLNIHLLSGGKSTSLKLIVN